jgi:hypothetical protein
MNNLETILSSISALEIRHAIHEIHELNKTGVLPDCIVRAKAKQIQNVVGVPMNDALSIVQNHALRSGAYKWAGIDSTA